MLPNLNKVKGVHPGAILKRELIKRGIKSVQLARILKEYPQTINAITKGRRGINPHLSIKLGDFFEISHDYFMLLQASYEVKKAYLKNGKPVPPLASKIRKSLFWDTKIENLDWKKNQRAIIQRLFERGTQQEIEELIKFYGMDVVREEIKYITNTFSPTYQENLRKYLANTPPQ